MWMLSSSSLPLICNSKSNNNQHPKQRVATSTPKASLSTWPKQKAIWGLLWRGMMVSCLDTWVIILIYSWKKSYNSLKIQSNILANSKMTQKTFRNRMSVKKLRTSKKNRSVWSASLRCKTISKMETNKLRINKTSNKIRNKLSKMLRKKKTFKKRTRNGFNIRRRKLMYCIPIWPIRYILDSYNSVTHLRE